MKYSPRYYEEFKQRFPRSAASFDQMARDCSEEGPLDKKTQLLVKLGIAIGIGSEGDVQNLTGQALEAGISPVDLRHAALLSMTTAGFPMMIAATQWVEEIIRQKAS